ncbi:MAG: 3'(2'),5'-bisphosphate nucleotidase CysQ, partial [Planctomycetes bacterium]|nr:3'(2'),5'-bisphosphate nucleotidase CysQ [Planctomycetota bacterium]
MPENKLIPILEELIVTMKKAGDRVLASYGRKNIIISKADSSPLTEADLASNRIIISSLKKYGWPILSEEGTEDKNRLGAELVWIIDPLDGTKEFIQE